MSVSYGGSSITFEDGSIVSSGSAGFKNKIINGAMTINQRYSGAQTMTSDGIYVLDRWQLYGWPQNPSSISAQLVATPAPVAEYVNCQKITSTGANSVGSLAYTSVCQPIEGYNIADLSWGTSNAKAVTLSFWVYSSLTGTFGGSLQNADRSRSYPFTYTINSANTWEYETITIPGPTTGTWGATNGVGLQLGFQMGVGSTYLGTAGSWANANYWGATGATNMITTSGATWYVTGVQLEKGTTASSFEFRSIQKELMLCQRYYEKGGISTRSGNRTNGTSQTIQAYYKVQKRDTPTFAVSGGYTADGWGTYNIGGHDNPSGSNDRLNWGNLEAIATSSVGSSGVIACVWTSIAEL